VQNSTLGMQLFDHPADGYLYHGGYETGRLACWIMNNTETDIFIQAMISLHIDFSSYKSETVLQIFMGFSAYTLFTE